MLLKQSVHMVPLRAASWLPVALANVIHGMLAVSIRYRPPRLHPLHPLPNPLQLPLNDHAVAATPES